MLKEGSSVAAAGELNAPHQLPGGYRLVCQARHQRQTHGRSAGLRYSDVLRDNEGSCETTV